MVRSLQIGMVLVALEEHLLKVIVATCEAMRVAEDAKPLSAFELYHSEFLAVENNIFIIFFRTLSVLKICTYSNLSAITKIADGFQFKIPRICLIASSATEKQIRVSEEKPVRSVRLTVSCT